jgi:hypothetical protein
MSVWAAEMDLGTDLRTDFRNGFKNGFRKEFTRSLDGVMVTFDKKPILVHFIPKHIFR